MMAIKRKYLLIGHGRLCKKDISTGNKLKSGNKMRINEKCNFNNGTMIKI